MRRLYILTAGGVGPFPAVTSGIEVSGDVCGTWSPVNDSYELVGNLAFLADGAQGLKVIDVTDRANPIFVMQYGTEYAYGVFADQDYVYLVDRNWGLMIFTEAGW